MVITHSDVFTACIVAHAISCANADPSNPKNVHKRQIVFPVCAFPLPVTCSDVVMEQNVESTLKVLFYQFLSDEEVQSAAHGYFLQDGLLVRKWLPQRDCFVGEETIQIVVSSKLRNTVLQAAHDGATGHLGVRKPYDNVLRYFYGRCLKKDISEFIKTCHTCQLTGKSNQTIRPAPLCQTPEQNIHLNILSLTVLVLCCNQKLEILSYSVICQTTHYRAAYTLHNQKIRGKSSDTIYVHIWYHIGDSNKSRSNFSSNVCRDPKTVKYQVFTVQCILCSVPRCS